MQRRNSFSETLYSYMLRYQFKQKSHFSEKVVGIGTATWTNDWGYPQWHLVLCLAIAWTFAFFCVFRGVKSIGKVVYFTATFPYVILTALLIRALTMEGSSKGILYFITPQWELLQSPGVWADATSQVFFSFGIAWGTLIVLSSFNKVSAAKILLNDQK